jgi:rfaE bifunctional protein nucleotidyltransferase chain/domain
MARSFDELLFFASLHEGASLRRRVAAECAQDVLAAGALITECLRAGHKVLFFGNGGSAADAQHLAAELVCRYKDDRQPLAGIALTTDTSALTAIANDYGFDQIFARQATALAAPGDVAVAITTSGRSANVTLGMAAARARGAKVVALTSARAPDEFLRSCDVAICVPSTHVARIQELHIAIGHFLCELVDAHARQPLAAPEGRRPPLTKAVTLDELGPAREYWRAQKQTVVFTNGCFDVLHAGHVQSLEAARALGDILVVGLNSDSSVRALKGEGRPICPLEARVAVLSALEAVSHVVVFDETTPIATLERLRPDVHCKGADYENKPIPEAETVRAYGGRVALLPLVPGVSSTSILTRL